MKIMLMWTYQGKEFKRKAKPKMERCVSERYCRDGDETSANTAIAHNLGPVDQ